MATVIGTDATDILDGTTIGDTITAGGGDDLIFGNTGRDTVRGGTGDDYIEGNEGHDRLFGQDGWDWLVGGAATMLMAAHRAPRLQRRDNASVPARGRRLRIAVNLATGKATDTFGNTDTLVDIERAVDSDFADTLIGGNAANDSSERFRGNEGSDTINGGSGFDTADYSRDFFNGGDMGIVPILFSEPCATDLAISTMSAISKPSEVPSSPTRCTAAPQTNFRAIRRQ